MSRLAKLALFSTLFAFFSAGDTDAATILERLRNRIFATKKHPLILVPGDGGSQLEAKLNKTETVHYFCERRTNDYFDLWVNLELMVPYVLDCWVDNMRLLYDNKTRTTRSPDGVHVRVPGFGNTSTVEWLDPSQVSPTAYFTRIVEALVALGYQRGIDVRGAPYDFRKAPMISTFVAYTVDAVKFNDQCRCTCGDGHVTITIYKMETRGGRQCKCTAYLARCFSGLCMSVSQLFFNNYSWSIPSHCWVTGSSVNVCLHLAELSACNRFPWVMNFGLREVSPG
ncbi:hypothetical protein HPB51_029397 [Rhipicephalus microplus]|uniref:Uncharacterized protein n=1 Tax=Rhipicephalus microplus TaxID=6941 RepID=A0A9J6CUE1_RHIMP|nr:hypothetical protein HPB51_029397 [Rhipicephalus microplus]